MTDKIRRRQIQIETHEVTIIRRQSNRFAYCQVCQAMVAAITPDDLALLTRRPLEEILTAQSEIHFIDASEGTEGAICGASLGDKKLK